MSDSILSGLESFGLGGLEGMSLFEQPKKEEAAAKSEAGPKVIEFKEEDFLFDKSANCPVCGKDFKFRAVKGSKARLINTERNLRPVYEQLDVLKYDAILCPNCGYTALTRYFPTLMDSQKKLIREKISATFRSMGKDPEVFTYDDAMDRYKLALANAVVKNAKASEKAFICLKSAWVIRGMYEKAGSEDSNYEKLLKIEQDYLQNAFEGFCVAIQSESFPMAGMDPTTVEYLIAALAYETKHYDVCAKSISRLLTSNSTNNRIKDKARDLKEELLVAVKNQGNA